MLQANVRAALGAATEQPQLVKKLEAKREARKKQREAEASAKASEPEREEPERPKADAEEMARRRPQDSELSLIHI